MTRLKLAHAFGWWDKHRVERQTHAGEGPLVALLYWACWLLLAGVFVYLIF